MKLSLLAVFLFTISSLAVQGAEIVIVGEAAHGYDPVVSQEISIISSSKSNCLFLEVSPSATQGMQAYVAGTANYEHSVGAWITAVDKASSESFENIIPANLLEAARNSNLKVFGVDAEVLDTTWRAQNDAAVALMRTAGTNKAIWQKIADIAITARNQTMAANIASDSKSASCENSFFIVGTAHTQSTYQDVPVTPIQTVLSNAGIQVSVVQTKLCTENCDGGGFFP